MQMRGLMVIVGQLCTNCYIVYDNDTKRGVVIDPGDNANEIIRNIQSNGITVEKIFLTHTHFDHVGAVTEIQKYTGAPILVHENETNIKKSWLYATVEDGQTVSCGDLKFEFMLTPGHTGGSMCIKCEMALFTGDTLFKEECGRCDLVGGDYNQMLKSLNRLSKLEGDYTVHPGHGDMSALSHERQFNQYMKESQ